jgi:hypothetical protein
LSDPGNLGCNEAQKKDVDSGDLPILVLEGPPRKRGQIHGESLRGKINEIISIWKEEFHKVHHIHPDRYIEDFLAYQKFDKAIERWVPDLKEEVFGIAEAAGVDQKTMYAFQLLDEEWWFAAHRKKGVPLPEAGNCSALGVFNQERLPTMLAQTMDIASYTDKHEVLFRIKHQDSALETLVFSFAGIIAMCGMNNRSLGICCNTLLQLDHRPDGLPVAYIVRGVLAKKIYADAVEFIETIAHASGQNYTIGGPREATSLECSANKVCRYIPHEGATQVYHTNHPLVNDDKGIYLKMVAKVPENKRPKPPDKSEIRFNAIEKRLKDSEKGIDVAAIKAILSSHDDAKNPVCRHILPGGDGVFTAACVIYELGNSPVLQLAPGPPCSTEFRRYEL